MAAAQLARSALAVALLVGFALTPVIATGAAASEAETRVALHAPRYSPATISDPQVASAKSAALATTVAQTATQKPFPIGYVIGGTLVILGVIGGIYGQRMRIRGRRPPRK